MARRKSANDNGTKPSPKLDFDSVLQFDVVDDAHEEADGSIIVHLRAGYGFGDDYRQGEWTYKHKHKFGSVIEARLALRAVRACTCAECRRFWEYQGSIPRNKR